ncbi:hypothetical protein ALC62_04047 [Cyphomyrmex costatus]|uniref:Uncharacterized protein n=1 Tax=Cyphomyrmex costatus TaxID=456900 RepID=A0A195CY32_9HYME|nr:hypothetical protein ALC62_04047 [Cyphomyrmex costatus]
MAVIAVGSRPETPDVTKFFELPAVDRKFGGTGGRGGGGGDLLCPYYARLPVGFSFGRSCLHLYRITRPSSLESTKWRCESRAPGPVVRRFYGPGCRVIIEFLFRPFTKCTLVAFLRKSRDGDELTLGRDERRIRVLVVYEHTVIQTPSCLGSLVNPRIAYIPSRFIAAQTFFFSFFFPLHLPLSRSLPFSLPGGPCLSLQWVLGFSPLGGTAKVST